MGIYDQVAALVFDNDPMLLARYEPSSDGQKDDCIINAIIRNIPDIMEKSNMNIKSSHVTFGEYVTRCRQY